MYYLLSDFKLIGAYYVPVKPLKTTTKKALIYGMLHYKDVAVPISIVLKLGKTPVIHRAYGESKRETNDNYKKLQALYKTAVKENINNLSNIRHKRIMSSLRYWMCFFLFIIGLIVTLIMAIVYEYMETFYSFLLGIGCIALYKKQCK